MRKRSWKHALLTIATGAMLFQASSCTQGQLSVITAGTVVTAASSVYLVYRIFK